MSGGSLKYLGSARSAWLLGIACLVVFVSVQLLPAIALGRPGGGESYSGGGSSGGGSSGGGSGAEIGLLIDLVVLCIHYPALGVPLLIIAVFFIVMKARHEKKNKGWSAGVPQSQVRAGPPRGVTRNTLEQIRSRDANFSVVLFEDFLYTLYAEMHRSRAQGMAGRLGPYVSPSVQQAISDPSLAAIEGVVIGAMRYISLQLRPDHVEVVAEFESNLTEVRNNQRTRWYIKDRVTLRRSATARSRLPQRSRTLDCPNCGAPLEAVRGNVCSYCREQVSDGRFDWSVTNLNLLKSEPRPPLLFSNVDEQGTEGQTIVDPSAQQRFGALCSRDANVNLQNMNARAAMIFAELQVGWSEQNLARIRPFTSDNLFQYFAYWIDMYQQVQARNVSEKARITRIELANVSSDAYYDSVTLRLFATGLDYTLDAKGKLLKGSRKHERAYSEYWTLIRGSQVRGQPRVEPSCPSCGAPLRVSMVGNCEYCSAKVVSGDFDWVLSRIEQDESYSG
jgi:hypothetical protein